MNGAPPSPKGSDAWATSATLRPAGAAEPAPLAAALDLSSCDREPIHVPGSIQPHGFLLALHPETLVVEVASANAERYLDKPVRSILGSPLAALFEERDAARLALELLPAALARTPRLLAPLTVGGAGLREARSFEVVAHQSRRSGGGACTILEFEELRQPIDAEAINTRLYNFSSANAAGLTLAAILDAAVVELRALSGCDRVVLYSFDEEGHGLVMAEDRGPEFASYLGLRFPASDVPAQARRMYEQTRVRIIPDVDYQPSPLVGENAQAAAELDLSFSMLRSVSPVHRAYMRNMGTVCSMSVSILVNGRLWGLVSCHHHEPRYVPLRLRAACDLVMQRVSAQIESEAGAEHLRRVLATREVHRELLSAMASTENYLDALAANPGPLLHLLGADGVAIVTGKMTRSFGVTPQEAELLQLSQWLRKTHGEEVFASSRLSEVYPAGAAFAGAGSGLVAVTLSKLHTTQVLWFRREIIATVRWAGDPHKPAVPDGGAPLAPGVTIHPRHSFEEWSQIVRGRSAPWTPEQVAAAAELRSAVIEIVLKRAEEMADLAASLKVANEELEAFSYSVSHDLRAPFRHISGFSEMLREEEASRMSARGLHYLQTIMDSARFAGLLVDSLLDFSRIARSKLVAVEVDMNRLFDQEWAAVLAEEGQGRTVGFRRASLPCVQGDPNLLRQVVRNLLSNAVKYTSNVEQPLVEVGARHIDHEVVFSIEDNGAGFDQQYAGKLFGVFQRLHRAEEFQGTGIGLANVRRIVSRHGGRSWAEAEVGKGATFFFSMPATSAPEGA